MNFEFEKYLNKAAAKIGTSAEETLQDFVNYSIFKQVHLSQSQRGLFSGAFMTMYFDIMHFAEDENAEANFSNFYKNIQKSLKNSYPFMSVMFDSSKQEYAKNVDRARIYQHEDFRLPMTFSDHSCGNGSRILATLGYVVSHYGRDALLNKEVIISDKDSYQSCTALLQILQHCHHHKIPIGKIVAKREDAIMFSCVARKPAQSLMQLSPIPMAVDRLIAA